LDGIVKTYLRACDMTIWWLCATMGTQKVRRLVYMKIINFTDTVQLVTTICHYNTAQLTIKPHLTTM